MEIPIPLKVNVSPQKVMLTVGTEVVQQVNTDYEQLTNLPQINGVTLLGDRSAAELGLVTPSQIPSVPGAYTSNPAALGAASPGSATSWARGDHVHPKPSAADIGAGTYSKPSGGIPASDLASAVQTSLGKADSALQAVPNTYRTAAAQDAIDAGKQNKLAEKQLVYYAVCSTSASTQAKTLTVTGVTALTEGLCLRVKFSNAQGYNGAPTLNVNSLGAKTVRRVGGTNAARYEWLAGEVLDLVYDGTYWVIVDGGLATTSYYGLTLLQSSATSTKTDRALTPAALNSLWQNLISDIAAYSSSATYAVNDQVRYNYNIWICSTAITTAESWNEEHWTKLGTILELIEAKYSKPSGGIPASDLASGVIPSVPGAYTSNPAALGAASPGSAASWARGDHVHPKPGVGDIGAAAAPTTVTQSSPTAITLADNTVYYLNNVSSLTLSYPASGHWECLLVLTTVSSGTVTVTLPASSYIGSAPSFGNGETWELSIRDGVVAAGKAVAAS